MHTTTADGIANFYHHVIYFFVSQPHILTRLQSKRNKYYVSDTLKKYYKKASYEQNHVIYLHGNIPFHPQTHDDQALDY